MALEVVESVGLDWLSECLLCRSSLRLLEGRGGEGRLKRLLLGLGPLLELEGGVWLLGDEGRGRSH